MTASMLREHNSWSVPPTTTLGALGATGALRASLVLPRARLNQHLTIFRLSADEFFHEPVQHGIRGPFLPWPGCQCSSKASHMDVDSR